VSAPRPKPGESYLYEHAEEVLDVEVGEFPAGAFLLFHLRMPADFKLIGVDNPITVAVPLECCEVST
jgi:hypothetical protein